MDKPDTIFLLSVHTAVIVHAKQEYQAWGKIMWENTIAKHNLNITNGNQISFPFLLERLNQKFYSIVGENLTETNKRAISCFFTNTIPQSELVVSYDSFCKVKAVKHTFWDWFYHAMKLIKDVKNLKEMVGRGHIEGFISYGETITKLMSCTNGTFLVRFSESVLGALTISYNDNGVITHVSDFNKDKLAAIPLIDTIRDSIKLSMLYPNICKSVFETYQSKEKVAVQRSGGNNRGYKKFFDLFHK